MKKHFLFMAGYYGSELIEKKSNQLIWANAKEVLFGKQTLQLPLPFHQFRSTMDLTVGDTIQEIVLIGGLLKVGAYKKTILGLRKYAQQMGCEKIHTIPWDWRMGSLHGAVAIDEKIKSLRQSATDQFYIVAHSYGGLALSYYLRYGTQAPNNAKENWYGLQQIEKSALVAVPFRGTMAVFKNMFMGQSRGLNKKLLSPRAYCTFPSAYHLLPPEGYSACWDENLQPTMMDIWNPENWEQYKWGFFGDSIDRESVSHAKLLDFTAEQLSLAQNMHTLTLSPTKTYPEDKLHKVLYLEGGNVATWEKCIWNKNNIQQTSLLFDLQQSKRSYPKFKNSQFSVLGDGTIPDYSSLPLDWLKNPYNEYVKTNKEHLDVLENQDGINIIGNFMQSTSTSKATTKPSAQSSAQSQHTF